MKTYGRNYDEILFKTALIICIILICGCSGKVTEEIVSPDDSSEKDSTSITNDIIEEVNRLEYKDLDLISKHLREEIDRTMISIETEFDEMFNNLADNRSTFISQSYMIDDWINNSIDKAEKLFSTINTDSRAYYLVLAIDSGAYDSLYPEDKLGDFYLIGYNAFIDVYGLVYSKHMDILSKACNISGISSEEIQHYKELTSNLIEEMNKIRDEYFEKFNDLYQSVRKEFLHGSIDILKYY